MGSIRGLEVGFFSEKENEKEKKKHSPEVKTDLRRCVMECRKETSRAVGHRRRSGIKKSK